MATSERVIFVHGTFSNSRAGGEPERPWWMAGSGFSERLADELKSRGSAARVPADGEEFAWTGENLESARRTAGLALAKRLRELEASEEEFRYHLVAHSHGGNVVLRALEEVDAAKLGAVVFLGTPCLQFRRSGRC